MYLYDVIRALTLHSSSRYMYVRHVHSSIVDKTPSCMQKTAHLSWYDECQTSDLFAKHFSTTMQHPPFQHVGHIMS
jgi:hypothetical protein